MLCPESLAASVSAAGIAFAKDKTPEQLALFSCVFMQLADILATIAAARQICVNNNSSGNGNSIQNDSDNSNKEKNPPAGD